MRTETFTSLDCREFDELVEEHLGLKLDRSWPRDTKLEVGVHWWEGIQQDCMASQDTYVIFENDPARWEESIHVYNEWAEMDPPYDCRNGTGALAHNCAAELFKKGVFPPEYRVFVQIWW